MKTKSNLFFTAIIVLLFISCAKSFYQVYKAAPIDKLTKRNNCLVYEDNSCIISYDFWSEGGNMGFRFYNKTDKNIYLHLGKSFFIRDGIAYDYFKDRVFTTTLSSSRISTKSKPLAAIERPSIFATNRVETINNSGMSASSGISISYHEKKIICVPPMSSKMITEYNIRDSLYRDCNLFRYPTKKQVKSESFSETTSPFVFGNRIAYTVGQSDSLIRFKNEFYIASISNYPKRDVLVLKYDEFCGQKSRTRSIHFKGASPDKFYIKYTKALDTWTH